MRPRTAGFQLHLTKPVETRQLVEAIAHLACANEGGEEDAESFSFDVTENYSDMSQGADTSDGG